MKKTVLYDSLLWSLFVINACALALPKAWGFVLFGATGMQFGLLHVHADGYAEATSLARFLRGLAGIANVWQLDAPHVVQGWCLIGLSVALMSVALLEHFLVTHGFDLPLALGAVAASLWAGAVHRMLAWGEGNLR